MDGCLIISGCLFEADDVINFPVIFFTFAEVLANTESKQKLDLLSTMAHVCFDTPTVLSGNQLRVLFTKICNL